MNVSKLFQPQKLAVKIQGANREFADQVLQSQQGQRPWTSLEAPGKNSSKISLNRVESAILKVINFVIKIFNKNYGSIDSVFSALDELKALKKIHHKITKLNIQPGEHSSPYVLVANKVDLIATRARLGALKAQVACGHLSALQEALTRQNTTLATEKYQALPGKLRTALSHIATTQTGTKSEKNTQEVHQMLSVLSKTVDEHGQNVFNQVEKLLSRKQKLSWNLSILETIERRHSSGGSIESLEKDLNELGEEQRSFILQGKPLSALPHNVVMERVHTALIAIRDNELKAIDETFEELLKQVEYDLSIYEVSTSRLTQDIKADILAKPVSVTMVGAEFSGLIKEGGLGEALEGIAKAMKKQHSGNNVRVIFPKFSTLPAKVQEQLKATAPQTFSDKQGHPFKAYRTEMEGLEFYFVEHSSFELKGKEPSIYDEEQMERFAAFSGLAADLIKQIAPTDIIHLHDWHVAGVALRLKSDDPSEWKEGKIPPVVFTYHNNSRAAQGRFATGVYHYTPMIQGLVKAGIAAQGTNVFVDTIQIADAVTTVSETFGIESQQVSKGEGISFAIRDAAKSGKLTGVINGSNPDRWNPEKSKVLKEWKDIETGEPVDLSYGPDSDIIQKKNLARQQLQKWLKRYMPSAKIDLSKPVVTFIGRFDAYQKGLDKLDEMIAATLKSGGQFIVMGAKPKDEDPEAKKILDALEKKYPEGVLFIRDYKDPSGAFHYQQGDKERPGIGEVVRAVTDMVGLPSSYEPCGLVQFEGWLFGSLALGSNTGGLADTIITPDSNEKAFNGFIFEREGTDKLSIAQVIPRAINKWKAFSNAEKQSIMKRLILDARKFSWSTSPSGYSPVEKYRFVYENARLRLTLRGKEQGHYNLQKYLYKVREPSRLPKEKPVSNGVQLEENYHRQYYASRSDSQNLDAAYNALHPGFRMQVPSPYGKNVDFQSYKEFGAHLQGETTRFKVSAPNASTVTLKLMSENLPFSVPMQKQQDGSWMLTTKAPAGTRYQYLVNGKAKIDPYGLQHESQASWSVVAERNGHQWQDGPWMQQRLEKTGQPQPMSIYELHATTWKKKDGRTLNYRELAHELIQHCQKTGFTHVELMGILEHPCETSWGYQVTGFFAPNSRMGSIDDFKYLVDHLHKHQIGVILDWVPAHFATDDYGLSNFDGKEQYEPPKQSILQALRQKIFGPHFNWGTKYFNFKKKSVREFLISSAAYWLKEMHIDALRVDAVEAVLMDKSKESRLFLKDLNAVVHHHFPGALTIAEDYSGSQSTTKSTAVEGLGFDMKWHVGWMQHTLNYFTKSLSKRPGHYQELIKAIENDTFHRQVMAMSHDQLNTGAKALIDKTPDLKDKEKYANLRSMISFMMCLPGKKLMFMGSEIGTSEDWTTLLGKDRGLLDTQQKEQAAQTMATIQGLHALYKDNKALWEHDDNGRDMEWIERNDSARQIIAYRRTSSEGQSLACLHNFANKTREYVVKLPENSSAEMISELLNTDASPFGGEGRTNPQIAVVRDVKGVAVSYTVTVPPLSTVVVKESSK
ncbi:MAG: glycogen/starch synthase [Parachlamydia sp.]|nr:glycogen/starch synthase [Parachlamydia sp.]